MSYAYACLKIGRWGRHSPYNHHLPIPPFLPFCCRMVLYELFFLGFTCPDFPKKAPNILISHGLTTPFEVTRLDSQHPLRFPARPRAQLFIVHKERAVEDEYAFSGRRKSRRGRFLRARRFVGGKKAPFDAASHPAAAEDSAITVRIKQCRPSWR